MNLCQLSCLWSGYTASTGQIFRISTVRYAKGLWRMRRHGPVIAHCTDSEDFPFHSLRPLQYLSRSVCVLCYLLPTMQRCCFRDRKQDGVCLCFVNLGRLCNWRRLIILRVISCTTVSGYCIMLTAEMTTYINGILRQCGHYQTKMWGLYTFAWVPRLHRYWFAACQCFYEYFRLAFIVSEKF